MTLLPRHTEMQETYRDIFSPNTDARVYTELLLMSFPVGMPLHWLLGLV